ncbi:MAG: aspartate aminotransferase family protein [Euryarchaeota archaeon]|nr:aspartate aminotransferase family protein [Euryarchaeota archaeon]
MNIREAEERYVMDLYPRRGIALTKGKGCRLYDNERNEYIDCAANVGVSNIGHGNEKVAKAIHDQYRKLSNCYGIFYNDTRARLAKKLVEITPAGLEKVFFCNSGSESVEAAIKFARASTGRSKIITAMRGFHGKTMGALSATWGPKYQKPFTPVLNGFVHVPFNNFARLEKKVTEDTAAILLEVVQGEGGVNIGEKRFFKKVRKLCDKKNILLIIDEVQTGFGRTGTLFASEQYVTPDILCLAKSIAGGVPMGAVVCSGNVKVPKKSHTTTFGGNPLACAAALASIEIIEQENLAKRSAELGSYFLKQLHTIESPKIREVRGLGLMIGIELKERAGSYVKELMERGIIALLAGSCVIRLLPPLIIEKKEIDRVVEALREILC